MNSAHLVIQGSTMWQGVMRAWSTIQSGLEQQDPQSWSEIARQPLFGNKFLTNERGVQWGTEFRSNMRWWSEKKFSTLQDIAKIDGGGWKSFAELCRLSTTREIVTNSTEIQNKTIEGLCCFGRVVGVIL